MKMRQLKSLSFLLVCILFFCDGLEAGTRVSLLGLAPAYPREITQFVAESKLPYFLHEQLVAVVLDVDKNGGVTRVAAESISDSAFARYVRPWIEAIRFEPATFNGDKVSSRLPVMLQLQQRVIAPDLHFPVDTAASVTDAELYFRTFPLNGIQLPTVEEFPPYFCDVKWSDTSTIFKYVLVKVGLDKSGQVTDVAEVAATFPAFSRQIMSAVLWARFSPAVVQGRPVAADAFVLISFFPLISYPTAVWRRSDLDSLGPLFKYRVRLLPDTIGLMSAPLPAKLPGDEFTMAERYLILRDMVSAVLSIDSSGHATVRRFSKVDKQIRKSLLELVKQLRFFPAVDYQGRPRQFTGLASFIFQASPKIRIRYHWLPSGDSAAER